MTNKVRGFEVVSKYIEDDGSTTINLPKRGSRESAGYDLESAVTISIPSIWTILDEVRDKKVSAVVDYMKGSGDQYLTQEDSSRLYAEITRDPEVAKSIKPTLVPTGIKAYMQENEFLLLPSRSSLPLKKYLIVTNGVGIIDKDYYGNPSTEGEIFAQVINFGLNPVTIEKGERLVQGIFMPFLVADSGNTDEDRTGGLGSSGGYSK